MKKPVFKFGGFLAILWMAVSCHEQPVSLEVLLDEESSFVAIQPIGSDTAVPRVFEIQVKQPLDHHHPKRGSFTQRIFLSHIDATRPVVLVTEGYAAMRNYTSEPAWLLEANQIIVEHRYFGRSVPDSSIFDWKYLTIEQAANDHHKIVEIFRKLYTGKWINTGVSKGGQTTMYHRYFFPEDVDVSVPYVGPLNFSVEDPRIYLFLDTVATPECRRKIHNFQVRMLEDRDTMFPWFKRAADTRNLDFTRITPEQAFEYCVLEYSFAFWQYGRWECDEIPGASVPDEACFEHFMDVINMVYFSDQGIRVYEPFFYQAMTEIGYYGYELDEFGNLLKHVTNPIFTFAAPQGIDLDFNPEIMKDVQEFLWTRGHHFIYIYGASDTWSATSVDIGTETNAIKIYQPGGAHGTRIRNLDESRQKRIVDTLGRWLEMEINNL
jgi:hypothetical protein